MEDHRHFVSVWNSRLLQAYEALRTVLECDGLRAVREVVAQVTWAAIRQALWREHGLRPTDQFASLEAIVGEVPKSRPTLPPGADHCQLLERTDGRRVLTYQPYALSWKDIVRLADLGRRGGWQARIEAAHAWWFPGQTMLVTIAQAA